MRITYKALKERARGLCARAGGDFTIYASGEPTNYVLTTNRGGDRIGGGSARECYTVIRAIENYIHTAPPLCVTYKTRRDINGNTLALKVDYARRLYTEEPCISDLFDAVQVKKSELRALREQVKQAGFIRAII